MTGCSKYDKISLQKKSDDVGIKIRNGNFNRKQGWITLNGLFMPSLNVVSQQCPPRNQQNTKIHYR
jgi:hypothetical protein